jgi:hypothetical protein
MVHWHTSGSERLRWSVPSSNRFTLFLESSDPVVVGPVFRTDDLMQVFRGAVIPSATGRSRSPPPAPRAAGECHYYFPDSSRCLTTQVGGRPPPDYGPYQGPGGVRRRY